jgi:hypothetical protein
MAGLPRRMEYDSYQLVNYAGYRRSIQCCQKNGLIRLSRPCSGSLAVAEARDWIFLGTAPMSKGPDEKRLLAAAATRSLKRLWHIGGPNIPCQVASPQSLTPFLRAWSAYRLSALCRNHLWTSELCLSKSTLGLRTTLWYADPGSTEKWSLLDLSACQIRRGLQLVFFLSLVFLSGSRHRHRGEANLGKRGNGRARVAMNVMLYSSTPSRASFMSSSAGVKSAGGGGAPSVSGLISSLIAAIVSISNFAVATARAAIEPNS